MIYPNTGGSYSMGDPNDLEQRKRELIQRLMASGARNQTGLSGLRSLPLFGGRGRGSTDLPNAALPSISFNPFLAMAQNHPAELFQAPPGITQAALTQAQAGLAPQASTGADQSQAAQAFLGTAGQNPGVDGPGAAPAAPAAGFNPANTGAGPDLNAWIQPTSAAGGANVRHLAGSGGTQPAVPNAIFTNPFLARLAGAISV